MFSITRKMVVSVVVLCVIFLIVTAITSLSVKNKITTSEYQRVTKQMQDDLSLHLSKKLDVGITNAVGISANSAIQSALSTQQRGLAIDALATISDLYKSNTNFKGIKVHLHDAQGRSFLRSWAPDKYGEELVQKRPLIAKVIAEKKAIAGFELGNVGFMIRAIAPVIDKDNGYLGSVEFLQGVGSISRDFATNEQVYLLVAKRSIAEQSAVIANSKRFGNYYSVNDKWFSDDVVAAYQKIDIDALTSNGYLVGDEYLFTAVPAKLDDGQTVGYHLMGTPAASVDNAIEQSLEMATKLIILFCLAFTVTILVLMYFFRSVIITPVHAISSNIAVIAAGDLTQEVGKFSNDELGSLSQDVEQMRNSLHDVINVVQQNSSQMSHSAQQVSDISSEISSSSRLQQQSSEQVLEAVNQLLEKSNDVSQYIERTTQVSRETLLIADKGIQVVHESIDELNTSVNSVNQTAQQMEELKVATNQISEITATIYNIAEQTNLLALNAAIEAARAGEQGRGFAVVADEVRELAARTSSSSGEISSLITQLIEKVDRSVASMQQVVGAVHQSQKKSTQTVESFAEMSDGISETTKSAEVIAKHSDEQEQSLRYLDGKLKDLFDVLNTSSNKAETTSMVASDLYHISEKLDKYLKGFVTNHSSEVTAKSDEKRRSPRAESKVMVHMVQGDESAEGLTDDISMNGLKVRAVQKLSQNTRLKIQIKLPKSLATKANGYINIDGTIIHMAPADGVYHYGVKFHNVTPTQEQQLKTMFDFFKQPYRYA